MTDYTRTALYRAFELTRVEACRYGVSIVGVRLSALFRWRRSLMQLLIILV